MRVEGSHRIVGCLTVDGGLANAYMSHLEVRAFASLRVRSYAFHVLSSCGSARTGSCTGAGSGPHACRASRPTPPHRPDRSGPGRRSAAARTTPRRRSRCANHRRDRQRPPTPPDRGGRPDASPSALPALSTRTGPTRSPGRARSTSPPHSSNSGNATAACATPAASHARTMADPPAAPRVGRDPTPRSRTRHNPTRKGLPLNLFERREPDGTW